MQIQKPNIKYIVIITVTLMVLLTIFGHKHLTKKDLPPGDPLPKEVAGKILIFYRDGCKDCKAIKDDLDAAISGNKEIVWVYTDTKNGKAAAETYHVTEVPSAVYVRTSGSYTRKVLYKTERNNTVFHKKNMDRLLRLQTEKR